MEHSILGGALAFIAFGANLLGTGLLLLFNPRDRVLRWYAVFSVLMLSWLLMQGVALTGGLSATAWYWYSIVVLMMPVAFMITSLVQVTKVGDRTGIAIMVVAFLVLKFAVRNPFEWRYQMWWHAVAWGSAAALYVVRGSRSSFPAKDSSGRRALDFILNLLVPVGVVGAILLRERFVVYGLPILTICTVFLLFIGIIYHRYYNIEIRALRSGDIGVRAAEHERLALLGEMSASIAHEVRNPLTGMRSLAQRLRDEPLDEDRRKRYLGVILDEIGRLENIVTNLLDVSRRTSTETGTGEVDLAPLFSDLELLVETRARGLGVQIVHQARGLRAAAPRDPLAQALLNLLLNAVAHAPRGTRVELIAESVKDGVMIMVRDQGPGIPAAERDQVFEPFHTGSSGTGLGLAVVRTLARDHKWKVEVADAPGGGAELRLTVGAASAV